MIFAHRDENIFIQVLFPQGIVVCVGGGGKGFLVFFLFFFFLKPGGPDSGNEKQTQCTSGSYHCDNQDSRFCFVSLRYCLGVRARKGWFLFWFH